ncbi:MAG: IS1380 family transposase [Solirubrobacterales bacterium]|nr:IS1380 family transposase [Solirubrobacterales bacterium]
MKVQRDGRSFTVEVTADGEGLVSHAGSALVSQVADKVGLTRALSRELSGMRERRSGHDPARILRDRCVMLADGGEALADLGAIREQEALFGEVASDSTAYRAIERIASEPELLESLRAARKQARAHAWELGLAPDQVTIELDATLLHSHSEKEGAAGNFKGGFGFHPMLAYFDETSEAAAGMLRPGNAGANTAADQIAVAEAALEQIPTARVEETEVLLRTDSAGATHELLEWASEGRIRFSVGFDLTDAVREAILKIPDSDWVSALGQDGEPRSNGEVAEITQLLDLEGWPQGARAIVRRERPHPGAQLSFTDHDGHRFQAILTDSEGDPAELERRHRARARVEEQIKDSKDTGLSKLPFRDFAMNAVWLELVLAAHDLLAWTKALLLSGELARSQPKRLRHRLLHVAGRLAFSGRRARLRLQASWPWAEALVAAFERLKALPAPSG